jgi:DNA replication protein DnaC
MKEAVEACYRLLRGEIWCAFLIGGVGNGKTHLAIGTLNKWTMDGRGAAFFVKLPDWLALMRKHAVPEEGQVDSEYLLDNYVAVPMLALDDLGSERVTDWGGEQIFRLLDKRYDAKRPTIVTSNAGKEALDPRIISRLREGLTICRGKDLRGAKI